MQTYFDSSDDFTEVGQDVFVAKVKNVNAQRPELLISCKIVEHPCLAGMHTAIDFNRQANFGATTGLQEQRHGGLPCLCRLPMV